MPTIRKALSRIRKKVYAKIEFITVFTRVFFLCTRMVLAKVFYSLARRQIVIIALYEHIGDIISCEPVLGYAKKIHPKSRIFWVVKKDYAELLECHPSINSLLKLHYFYEWILLRKFLLRAGFLQQNIIDLHINGKPCAKFKKKLDKGLNTLNFNNHLTGRGQLQAFTIAAGIPELNDQPFFYLNNNKKINLTNTSPYIVFHTQSNMRMKDWNTDDWNCLCTFCTKAGYYVVEVGINRLVTIEDEKYINLTGKMSLQSIASIINNSVLFVGIDSGFAHMANALQKDGLVLIGQYKIDKTVFNKYNPFTGMYADARFIVYADDDVVAAIPCSKVENRLSKKLNIQSCL